MNISEEQKTGHLWIKDSRDEILTPFEGDLWGREVLAERLTDYVSRLSVGATIAIDAEWGAGKSWFVKNWKAKLEQSEFNVIYLNAFNQDYIDDPFLTISMEIANCIKKDKKAFRSIKSVIEKTYQAILPNMPMLMWSLVATLTGIGAIAKPVADIMSTFKDTGEFGEEAAKLLNEKFQEHVSAQIENYENEKQSLEYFKYQLAEITNELPKPLVFIVDELDRCKPEFAIRLIERIKHFFDIPNVVFVLAINKPQLEQAINNYYGFSSASNYLEKFIDFSIMLKNNDNNGQKFKKILEKYNDDLKLSLVEDDLFYYIKLCMVYKPNPRQLVRILNKYSLLKSSTEKRRNIFLFIMLIYRELNLISEFNESCLFEHFMDTHKVFFEKEFNRFKQRYSQWDEMTQGPQILEFLDNEIYFTQESNLFEVLFFHIKFGSSQRDYRANPRESYLPENSIGKNVDLVGAWYKHIHMIIE